MFRIQPGPVEGLFTASADPLCRGQMPEVDLKSAHGGCVSCTG